MRKIDNIFAERIHNVRMAFVKTGGEMLRDFRGVQLPQPRIKTKVKGQNEETANANVAKAIAYAKAHSGTETTNYTSPWINRTARAARGVNATIDGNTEEISLKLSHGIYYGAYLEYGHNRKYAVLEPLIREYAPKLIADIKKIMGGE
jgi:hypothetical protein